MKCHEVTRTVPERCITPLAGLSHECYYETAEVHQQVIAQSHLLISHHLALSLIT